MKTKNFSDLERDEFDKKDAKARIVEKMAHRRERQDDHVGGGVFKHHGVNPEARQLTAKHPWYCHAPEPEKEPTFLETAAAKQARTLENRRKFRMTKGTKGTEQKLPPREMGHADMVDMDALTERLVEKISGSLVVEHARLAAALGDSRAAMDEAQAGIGLVMNEFKATMTSARDEVREKRYAIVTESAAAVKSLRDIRQFFLGQDYEKERDRLADFADLCERLQRLKNDGTLDAVSDTILRLAGCDDNG